MSSQTKSNNLNYLVDPRFIKANRYYSCYYLKMKIIEFLLKNTTCKLEEVMTTQ